MRLTLDEEINAGLSFVRHIHCNRAAKTGRSTEEATKRIGETILPFDVSSATRNEKEQRTS
jgi:hypothetical protein